MMYYLSQFCSLARQLFHFSHLPQTHSRSRIQLAVQLIWKALNGLIRGLGLGLFPPCGFTSFTPASSYVGLTTESQEARVEVQCLLKQKLRITFNDTSASFIVLSKSQSQTRPKGLMDKQHIAKVHQRDTNRCDPLGVISITDNFKMVFTSQVYQPYRQ